MPVARHAAPVHNRAMTDVRSTASEKRRRAILAAALGCFARDGFAATTMDEIRSASGASIGSIYHHFASKELLAGALYLEGIREYQDGLLRALTRPPAAREGIRAAVSYHLRWIRENADWARFLLAARDANFMSPNEAELRAMNRAFTEALAAWFRPFVEQGAVAAFPSDAVLPILLSPAQAFGRLWLSGRATTSIERAEDVFGDAAWNAIRAPESQGRWRPSV